MKAIKKRKLLKIAVLAAATILGLAMYFGGMGPSPASAEDPLPPEDSCPGGPSDPCPPEEIVHGRITGGGSVFNAPTGEFVTINGGTDGRVTHGFELHCVPEDGANNLQINWKDVNGDAQRFHLETLINSLGNSTCTCNPTIGSPYPPVAGFNTYSGDGFGRFNGVSGAFARWIFTDAGEPGTNDSATIFITDVGGTPVLFVSGNLHKGNHQFHKEQGFPAPDICPPPGS